MNSKEIRQAWIDFFKSKNHLEVPSKSLIPVNDPSLLWINSGVATLKDYFSGKKTPPKNRIVNSQKAIRTNDIENVGITARHHTFFEMLGNFSIGNYFKKEAIEFAYEFLFSILKLEKSRIYITYFEEDADTKDYWMNVGIEESHLIKGTRDTNFWDVGSGPCGPDTEIFYDRGAKYDSRGLELLINDIENDRYIEIWNIVFSQFNNNGENVYSELKQKNIDTGAGLERIVSVMQDAPTNFDSDLFQPIIHKIEEFTEFKYDIDNYFKKDPVQSEINTCFKIIADHIRTVVNAIADGAKVSNVGRGYIIRRLIRRSVYKGMQLKIKGLFLHKLVQTVKDSLPFEYDVQRVIAEIKKEELLFHETIDKGRELLEKNITSDMKVFNGEVAFNLFETYGFPVELTKEILAEKNIDIDMSEYENAKQKHIEASRGEKVSGMDKVINSMALINGKIGQFVGYDYTQNQTKVLKIYDAENELETLNGKGYIILENTPFYATSGGQNHDEGYIIQGNNKIKVIDVFKDKHANNIHYVEGKINKNEPVACFVDEAKRLNLARGHSATHLLFSTLRKLYGPEIEQKGSDITYERFTFDFPLDRKPTHEEIIHIENRIKEIIHDDIKREYLISTTDEAKKLGAIMTISETEYMDPQKVRIVKWGNETMDLCGGTHLSHSSLLEDFKITQVDKKGAGIYRFRVVVSKRLVNEYYEQQNELLAEELSQIINKIQVIDPKFVFEYQLDFENIASEYQWYKESIEQLREVLREKIKQSSKVEINTEDLGIQNIDGFNIFIDINADPRNIKVIASTIREKYQDSIVVLAAQNENDTLLCVASKKYDALKVFNKLAELNNGRGGGSTIVAMGKISKNDDEKTLLNQTIEVLKGLDA